MAQHFFDLRYSAPGGTPSALKGAVAGLETYAFSGPVRIPSPTGEYAGWLVAAAFATPSAATRAFVGAGLELTDFEALVTIKRASTPTESYFNTGGGLLFRSGDSGNPFRSGYYVSLGDMSTDAFRRYLTVFRYDEGAQTEIARNSTALPARNGGQALDLETFIRLNVVGGVIRARTWWEDQTEPTTWQITHTDNTHASGDIGLLAFGYSSHCVFRFLSIGTDGDPAPMEPPGGDGPRLVQGTVFAPDDTPVGEGYSVRCYHRETGMLLGETTTSASGTFSFVLAVPQEEPLNLVAIDTVGNVWGSPSLDRVGGTED